MNVRSALIEKETAMAIHRMQIERHGGLDGVRDEGLLESALAQPWASFAGVDFYPTVEEKAARLCFEVISQHPFVDGNKRTATALMLVFLRGNGIEFKPRAIDLQNIIIGVASGVSTYDDLLDFIRCNA